jgi:hypothetical protein
LIEQNYGSIGPKGFNIVQFSIRTGIPGLSFRSGKSKDAAAIMLVIAVVAIGAVIAWNVLLFLVWAITEMYHFILRKKMEYNARKSIDNVSETPMQTDIEV